MNTVQPIRDIESIERMKNELARSGSRNRLLFCMGINTGLRVSDLLALRVGDVVGRDFFTLTEQKTGKRKKIALHAVRRDLDSYCAGLDPNAWLFPSKRNPSEHLGRVQAYRILNDAARAVGLEEIGTHTMRKTFGWHVYQQTHDVALLQEIFNHAAPSVTLRYIGVNQAIIDETLSKFAL